MTREAARAQAIAEFGDVDHVRSALREIDHRVARRRRRVEILDGVIQDVRYSIRALRRTPVVAITIIVTLALGLGANAAMFSLLDTIFLKPPTGVAHPGQIRRVWVERHFRNGTQYWPGYDYMQYEGIAKAVDNQAAVTMYAHPQPRALARGENAPTVSVSGTLHNYFSVLGVNPAIGRFYDAEEGGLGNASAVAVISDALWKRSYGGTPDVLGKSISLANTAYTIIGVTPAGFSGMELDATDVWVPLSSFVGEPATNGAPWWRNPDANGFLVTMRLSPNAREGELVQRMTSILRSPDVGARRDTLAVAAFGAINRARGPGKVDAEMKVAARLVGVAIIVLVIACANVVNLLLARAVRRRREIAVHLALGISRRRLLRLLVIESVILAVLAAVGALAAAHWGGTMIRVLLMPEVQWASSPLNMRVLLFALAIAITAGALAGLIPALQAASPDLTGSLKSGVREGGSQRSRLRGLLVTAQAALSVVLLVGAMLFVQSLHNAKTRDIGYTVDRLMFASVRFETRDSARDANFSQRFRALESRIAAVPGVERVAFSWLQPKTSFATTTYFPDADTIAHKKPDGFFSTVTPSFFETAGMRLLHGRNFDRSLDGGGPPPVIVNKAMADALWPGESPIGRCVRFEQPTLSCGVVIGVVQTAIVLSFTEDPVPSFFTSIDHPAVQRPRARTLIIRGDPARIPAIQSALRTMFVAEFPGAIPRFTMMAQSMEREYRPWDLGAKLFTLFGVLALVVAAVGVFSTVSYAVDQRTHEFGVRIALGAQAGDVLRHVLIGGIKTVVVGVVAGVLLSLASGKLVSSLL
ncbi:MAG TPA: ABC transporter permease, partial [Gemmatimonadaceae bacterium]